MKSFLALAFLLAACGANDPSGEGSADLSSTDPPSSISADCTPQECGPQPEVPIDKCPGGGYAGPVCERVDGQCAWHLTHCPESTVSTIKIHDCQDPPSVVPPHAGCKWDAAHCEWLCI